MRKLPLSQGFRESGCTCLPSRILTAAYGRLHASDAKASCLSSDSGPDMPPLGMLVHQQHRRASPGRGTVAATQALRLRLPGTAWGPSTAREHEFPGAWALRSLG